MNFSENELKEIFKIFKNETDEHIDNINKALLKLEKNPSNTDLIAELFREAHSIKGSARMIGASAIQKLAHKIEDLFKIFKDGAIPVSAEIIDIAYDGIDTINKTMKQLSPNNLDFYIEEYIDVIFKIDLIKDSITLEEKKNKTTNKTTPITENKLINENSLQKYLKSNISLLDNKAQKDSAILFLLNLIEEELKKGLPQNERNILEITQDNLQYIKEHNILPPTEIVQIIEQALKSIGTNPSEEKLEQIIKKQQTIKQLLSLNKDKELFFNKIPPQQTPEKPIIQKDIANSYIDKSFKTLRVDTTKLDKLEKQTEELIVLKIKNKQHLKTIKDTYIEFNELQKRLNKALNNIKNAERKALTLSGAELSTMKIIQKNLEKVNEKMESINKTMSTFQNNFFNDDSKFHLLTDEIDSTVKSIRILPLATILHMFPRMVRDISRNQGKQVEIIITGSETGADKTIIEELNSPLVHIINNAIDHGIEYPKERIEKGKNPTGKIILNSYNKNNSITIEISDDGQGINLNKIKEKAIKENLFTEEYLAQMTEQQILNLIFWPGFTTQDEVTNRSGRGVGLDAVHNTISRLDGKIKVETQNDVGFKITITIPIILATLKALLVKSNEQVFAIPSNYIKNVRSIIQEDIFTKEGKPHIFYNDTSVQLANLSTLLQYNTTQKHPFEKKEIVILQADENYIALEVDKLLKTEELIQKKLNPPLSRVKNIVGISSLPNGEPCFILNINDIIKSSLSSKNLIKSHTILSLPTNENKAYSILIVDDSYTTLMLEKNILKAAGYKTISATNGADALKKLTYEHADIIITDLQMPKMDGIEFIKKIREKDITTPIIVLTSHEEKLPNPNIQEYVYEIILKKDFSKELLLEKISSLLHQN